MYNLCYDTCVTKQTLCIGKDKIMAPNLKFTQEQIVDVAFSIFREKGFSFVTARHISEKMDASTSPIYSYFKSMEALEKELEQRCLALFTQYQQTDRTGDIFLDLGLGVVLFAKNEPNLYKSLDSFYNSNQDQLESKMMNQIKEVHYFKGLGEATVRVILSKMKIFSLGLADLVLQNSPLVQTEEQIIKYLYEVGGAVILFEHVSDEEKLRILG